MKNFLHSIFFGPLAIRMFPPTLCLDNVIRTSYMFRIFYTEFGGISYTNADGLEAADPVRVTIHHFTAIIWKKVHLIQSGERYAGA